MAMNSFEEGPNHDRIFADSVYGELRPESGPGEQTWFCFLTPLSGCDELLLEVKRGLRSLGEGYPLSNSIYSN